MSCTRKCVVLDPIKISPSSPSPSSPSLYGYRTVVF